MNARQEPYMLPNKPAARLVMGLATVIGLVVLLAGPGDGDWAQILVVFGCGAAILWGLLELSGELSRRRWMAVANLNHDRADRASLVWHRKRGESLFMVVVCGGGTWIVIRDYLENGAPWVLLLLIAPLALGHGALVGLVNTYRLRVRGQILTVVSGPVPDFLVGIQTSISEGSRAEIESRYAGRGGTVYFLALRAPNQELVTLAPAESFEQAMYLRQELEAILRETMPRKGRGKRWRRRGRRRKNKTPDGV